MFRLCRPAQRRTDWWNLSQSGHWPSQTPRPRLSFLTAINQSTPPALSVQGCWLRARHRTAPARLQLAGSFFFFFRSLALRRAAVCPLPRGPSATATTVWESRWPSPSPTAGRGARSTRPWSSCSGRSCFLSSSARARAASSPWCTLPSQTYSSTPSSWLAGWSSRCLLSLRPWAGPDDESSSSSSCSWCFQLYTVVSGIW